MHELFISMETNRKILLKRSSEEGKTPTAEQMAYGEVAINYCSKTEGLYIKNTNDEIVRIGVSKPVIENEFPSDGILKDNTIYNIGEITNLVIREIPSDNRDGIVINFSIGEIVPNVSFPSDAKWLGSKPVIDINTSYRITVLDNIFSINTIL